MRIKRLLFCLGYYVLCMPVYTCFFVLVMYMLLLVWNLSGLLYLDYLLLVMTPIIVGILTRFSILKWYVDPISAAEVPLAIYTLTKIYGWRITIYDFVAGWHDGLGEESVTCWLFFGVLYVVGLAASFSMARKRGENISNRIISKFTV